MKRRLTLFAGILVAVTAMMFSSCTQPNGKLLFWVNQDLGCGFIDVTINGDTKQISSFYASSTPDCDASGCATFDLAPGTYTVTASCTSYNWNFTKTVSSNTCTKTQLVP